MRVSEGISVSWNFLKMRVSEISVNQICANQGLLHSDTIKHDFYDS